MLWLEMSRNPIHGGGSWGFSFCLWSATSKRNTEAKWTYWENLLKVRAGDSVLHLRGIGKDAAFVGFSTAEADGFKTSDRPPIPGEGAYEKYFYRVLLKDFTLFPTQIYLQDVFKQQDTALRAYFNRNNAKPREQKKNIFYVVQSGHLQCLNGAYLSEVDDELAGLLLGIGYSEVSKAQPLIIDVKTSERIQELRTRVGQKDFSDNIRANYHHRCCFPNCPFTEDYFLVASHIARWADVQELRGNVSNGLCLCLIHDKAFEIGLFTIDRNFNVVVNRNCGMTMIGTWYQTNLLPFDGSPIRRGNITPSLEALQNHWKRVGIATESNV